jgi:predicted esterase YcpF (UPF0227 family)
LNTDPSGDTCASNVCSKLLAEETDDFVLVGSSMGGYVSLVAFEEVDAKAYF